VAEAARTERAPEADPEQDHQDARNVCGELVVQPGLARRERPEVGGVVVGRAERSRLSDVTRDPADVERHEGGETAEAGRTEHFNASG
jgi:hypothetical protein